MLYSGTTGSARTREKDVGGGGGVAPAPWTVGLCRKSGDV